MSDQPIAHTADGRPLYDNTATVVAVVVEFAEEILAIRRNTEPGKGLLALPGGFQMRGETWQEAGAREVFEEVGIVIPPNDIKLLDIITDEYNHNVVTAHCSLHRLPEYTINLFEVQEEIWINPYDKIPSIEEWAFDSHFRACMNVAMDIVVWER